MVVYAVIVVLGYLLGSFPTSLMLLRALGRADVRFQGSRSAGATNVLRVHGWRLALTVAVLDIAKGWGAAALLPQLAELAAQPIPGWLAPATGLAATVGHVWPLFVGFRGGKGVATAAGVVLALRPAVFLVILLVFIVVAARSRVVSIGSLSAALSLPVAWLALSLLPEKAAHPSAMVYSVLVAAFLVFTHRANLRNLLAGTEPRLGG